MKWQIGEFETSVEMKYGKENPNYELEKSILEEFKKLFDKELYVEERDIYTTLRYKDYDLLRLHYDNISKWVNVFIVPDNRDKYIDDPLFQEHDGYDKLMWYSSIRDADDLKMFIGIIEEDIEFIDKQD